MTAKCPHPYHAVADLRHLCALWIDVGALLLDYSEGLDGGTVHAGASGKLHSPSMHSICLAICEDEDVEVDEGVGSIKRRCLQRVAHSGFLQRLHEGLHLRLFFLEVLLFLRCIFLQLAILGLESVHSSAKAVDTGG